MSKILTFGVYDYFHLGHLRLFKQCKNMRIIWLLLFKMEIILKNISRMQ